MKKRVLILTGLALLALCVTSCDSFINQFVPNSSSSSSSVADTSSEERSSSSSNESSSSNSNASSASSSSSSSSSSSGPVEPNYVSFDVYAFNDTHGNVKDTYGEGLGISKTTSVIKELSKDKNTVLLSQGDMWQGSVESNYTRGRLVTEWMNTIGFAAMTVGNHEYDWGGEIVEQNSALAEFPMLGINVLDRYSDERVSYINPSVVITRGDAKIGVIGAIGNCLSSISSSKVRDVYFAKGDALTSLVKEESTRLRNEEKCDFIIYSIHGSGSRDEADSYDISLSSQGYVDLVLEGHTHDSYAELDSAGVYHVQCEGNNENIYQITVNVDVNNHVYDVEIPVSIDLSYATSPYKSYPLDNDVEALFEKYYDDYSFAYETIGRVAQGKNSSALKSKVADLYLEAGLKKWGKNYDIVLGGGYISCRGNNYLPAGNVNYAQLAALFPFDNDIVLCSVMGYYFRNTYFVKGNSNYFTNWTEYGEGIRSSINNYDTYYLITDSYSSDYAYNHLTVVDILESGTYARDLLADYIAAGNWA